MEFLRPDELNAYENCRMLVVSVGEKTAFPSLRPVWYHLGTLEGQSFN